VKIPRLGSYTRTAIGRSGIETRLDDSISLRIVEGCHDNTKRKTNPDRRGQPAKLDAVERLPKDQRLRNIEDFRRLGIDQPRS